jgi:hypothetical protein
MQNIARPRFVLRQMLAAVAILGLAACGNRSAPAPLVEGGGTSTPPVTNAVYEQALNRWLDHPEEDLIAAWGVPERSQRLTDGGQVLEYRRADGEGRLLCTTLFTSDIYGMVRTWTYRGADCRAPRLGDYGKAG